MTCEILIMDKYGVSIRYCDFQNMAGMRSDFLEVTPKWPPYDMILKIIRKEFWEV